MIFELEVICYEWMLGRCSWGKVGGGEWVFGRREREIWSHNDLA